MRPQCPNLFQKHVQGPNALLLHRPALMLFRSSPPNTLQLDRTYLDVEPREFVLSIGVVRFQVLKLWIIRCKCERWYQWWFHMLRNMLFIIIFILKRVRNEKKSRIIWSDHKCSWKQNNYQFSQLSNFRVNQSESPSNQNFALAWHKSERLWELFTN